MLTTILAAGGAAAGAENPYGLGQALKEGGLISQSVFTILCLMSIVSFYILFSKLFEQQKIINQAKRVRQSFWSSNSLREGSAKLEKNSAYKQIVDDGLAAQDQHSKLTDPVEAHDWLHGSLARSEAAINSKLGGGLAFLATVGATAPFIGLFGTVIGIYRALIKIGASGDPSRPTSSCTSTAAASSDSPRASCTFWSPPPESLRTVAAACTAAASESIGAATSTPTCRGEGGKGEGGG